MRTNKSTHAYRPIVQNSFRKTQRKYPDPKPVEIYNAVSQNRMQIQQHNALSSNIPVKSNKHTPIILGKKSGVRKYSFLVKQGIATNGQSKNQDTCLWSHFIENPIFDKQSRMINLVSGELVFRDFTGDAYPNLFYISMDGIMGFFDKSGKMTDRVAILELQQISPIWEDSHIKSYDLRYSIRKNYEWQIPVGVNAINLRLCDEQGDYVPLPLSNDMPLQIHITNK